MELNDTRIGGYWTCAVDRSMWEHRLEKLVSGSPIIFLGSVLRDIGQLAQEFILNQIIIQSRDYCKQLDT